MKLVKEFKQFISRGNVIDMAIGIIIGAAFTSIVNSLVKDIINPIIGYLMAGIDLSNFKFVLMEATLGPDGAILKPELAITYGVLINSIINFILVAIVLFFVIKGFNKLKELELVKKEELAEQQAIEDVNKPTELSLLTEILAELKANNNR